MLSRLDLRGTNADLSPLTARGDAIDASAVEGVRAIIAEVRGRGDAALHDLTEQFDGCTIDELRVPGDELLAALEDAPAEFRAALEYAREEVTAYHEAQLGGDVRVERNGVLLRELVVPVDRAGLYVPGGRATYPSTVLMTAIPARVAGVPEIALCVPPDRDGRVPTATLAAAALVGEAEHGPDGAAILVTWDDEVADAVEEAVGKLAADAPRRAEIEATLGSGGRTVLVDGPRMAVEAANAVAPEHLELITADPEALVPAVRNAGAVFCGPWSPAVVGDYVAGVNHVLPTARTARF